MLFPSPLPVPGSQLPAGTAVLFTVTNAPTQISVLVVNTHAATQTFNLYITRVGASTSQSVVPVNSSLITGAMYETSPLNLFVGDSVSGDASVATALDYTITALQFLQ